MGGAFERRREFRVARVSPDARCDEGATRAAHQRQRARLNECEVRLLREARAATVLRPLVRRQVAEGVLRVVRRPRAARGPVESGPRRGLDLADRPVRAPARRRIARGVVRAAAARGDAKLRPEQPAVLRRFKVGPEAVHAQVRRGEAPAQLLGHRLVALALAPRRLKLERHHPLLKDAGRRPLLPRGRRQHGCGRSSR